MQMISCLTVQVTMSEEMPPSQKTEGANVIKRSKRKQHDVTQSLPCGQISGDHVKTDSSCTDTGVLYLNPQTPSWCLVEKFAELSPEDEPGLNDDQQDHSSGELLQCFEHTENNNAVKKKERDCSKYLKETSGKQGAPKLRELNVAECGPGGAVNKKKNRNNPDKKTLKKCEDDKTSRLFAAMKKRSAFDAEHRPFKCSHCPWAFKKLCNLQSHLQTHTGLKPHVCDICGKAYSHQGTLQQHKRLHTGERPYHCPFCVKTYICRMVEHQKIHTGLRPYVCTVCSKCFTKSSNLTEHEAIHSGQRPHKCAECGVAFALPSRLVRHQYVHNKEKPHSCTGCSKNFSHLDTLKVHQEQTCAGRIYVCVECDKSFQCDAKLAQHMLSHRDKNV
ncbi:hypothetical protein PAMA_001837 [Pampus argenteus]